jgi:hypothetical protein
MSKIPQGEWSAIAARYAKGESISRIAQSYGCTPPAIHYILKKNKQRAVQKLNGHFASSRTYGSAPANRPEPDIRRSSEAGIEDKRASEVVPGDRRTIPERPAAAPSDPDRGTASALPTPGDQGPPVTPQHSVHHPGRGRGSAFTAGLDNELHGRAEAAIAAFRSSFDAALAEASPVVRQRLRQAASDLMRVAARTTIVLDRLNATVERDAAKTQPYYHRSDLR